MELSLCFRMLVVGFVPVSRATYLSCVRFFFGEEIVLVSRNCGQEHLDVHDAVSM